MKIFLATAAAAISGSVSIQTMIHPAETQSRTRKNRTGRTSRGLRTQKVSGIQIIASHQLAPEVIGRAVVTLIGTCPKGRRPSVSFQEKPDVESQSRSAFPGLAPAV